MCYSLVPFCCFLVEWVGTTVTKKCRRSAQSNGCTLPRDTTFATDNYRRLSPLVDMVSVSIATAHTKQPNRFVSDLSFTENHTSRQQMTQCDLPDSLKGTQHRMHPFIRAYHAQATLPAANLHCFTTANHQQCCWQEEEKHIQTSFQQLVQGGCNQAETNLPTPHPTQKCV